MQGSDHVLTATGAPPDAVSRTIATRLRPPPDCALIRSAEPGSVGAGPSVLDRGIASPETKVKRSVRQSCPAPSPSSPASAAPDAILCRFARATWSRAMIRLRPAAANR